MTEELISGYMARIVSADEVVDLIDKAGLQLPVVQTVGASA